MADSLRTRVSRVIAGGVHALIDKIEDQSPEAVMEQAVREADAVIDDVRHDLGLASANRHLAQQQHSTLNAEHERLSSQIEQAMAQGREDLARAAVSRQLDIEAQLPVLEASLAERSREETDLQGYVAALQAKKREMTDALVDFRKSRAAAAAQAPTQGAGVGSAERRIDDASAAFDRVHVRQTGLSATARGTSLAQGAQLRELEDLTRNNKIAERLAQLKAGKA